MQREQAGVLLVAHCFLDYRQRLLLQQPIKIKYHSLSSCLRLCLFVDEFPLSCVALHNECRAFLMPAVLTLLLRNLLRAGVVMWHILY